jgi:hypothetical protein
VIGGGCKFCCPIFAPASADVHRFVVKYPGLYEKHAALPLEPGYEAMSEVDRRIETDVYRTFPELPAFEKDTPEGEATVGALRRVLRCYAAFDAELGYCQGLNFLAGSLLMYLPEREAFWTLVALMQRSGPLLAGRAGAPMRGLFLEGLPLTQRALATLDGLVPQHLPRLGAHFARENLSANMFATEWFMTLYTRSFPVALTARVIDCVLAEGYKVVHRVALALLQSIESALLATDFEGAMLLFRELPKRLDPDAIMRRAFAFRLTQAQIVAIGGEQAL